jgi:RNA polymerase sigma-70 factor, ECF subfamily
MTAMALQNVQNAIIDLMPDLRRFARSLTGSTDAGNELVQTAYERALSRPDALATVDQPASWMYRIIRNIWIDGKRSSRERLSAPLEDAEHLGTEDTERAVIARSTLARVRTEMAALPEDLRSAIMLVCVDGLSYQDAATELDIPIGTLMSRLYRGRIQLAQCVKQPVQSSGSHNKASARVQ